MQDIRQNIRNFSALPRAGGKTCKKAPGGTKPPGVRGKKGSYPCLCIRIMQRRS